MVSQGVGREGHQKMGTTERPSVVGREISGVLRLQAPEHATSSLHYTTQVSSWAGGPGSKLLVMRV